MRRFIVVFMIVFLLIQPFSLQVTKASNSTVTGNTYGQNDNLSTTFVKVTNSANVSTQNVNDFIVKAQNTIKNEKQAENPQVSTFSQSLIKSTEIYDYFYIDESSKDMYFYEDNSNSNPIAKIVDLETKTTSSTLMKQSSDTTKLQSLAAVSTISGGMGARVIVPSGNLLEARIHTDSNIQQLNNNSGTTYTYVGFTGATEADAGLQYSPKNPSRKQNGVQAWKPYLKVGESDPWDNTAMLNGYDAVQYNNGFIPGEDVQVSFWKKYFHDNVSTTRMKLQGLAKCANSTCSNSTPTKLAVIMEKNGSGIADITNYKILATIADIKDPNTHVVLTRASGSLNASVSNITVDGVSRVPTESAKSSNSSMSISSNSVSFNIR